jgi:minor extracellular serine protease Vpr
MRSFLTAIPLFAALIGSNAALAQNPPQNPALDVAKATVRSTAHRKYFRPPSARVRPRQDSGDVAVVNSASFLPGVSPGALVTIFGNNLTDVTGLIVASTDPLPTVLSNVSVSINGVFAPIYTIAYANGEDQISVQVPYETPTGPGAAQVDVIEYGDVVASVVTDSFDEDPGIFVYQANYAVALRYPDYSLIGPNNPAFPGDVLILYATGLGPLTQPLADGYGAPANPPADTQDPFQVLVAGETCQIMFSGLAPGFVGLYQINLQLPFDLPAGDLDTQITSPFANSQVATLPIQ